MGLLQVILGIQILQANSQVNQANSQVNQAETALGLRSP